jgi:glutathione S-transferase
VPVLFHLAAAAEWAEAVAAGGPYARSMPGVPLDDVGFVHCSYDVQVEATLARWYPDRDDLLLLTIDPDRLDAPLRVEDGFPHVYGPLPLRAVVATSPARPA